MNKKNSQDVYSKPVILVLFFGANRTLLFVRSTIRALARLHSLTAIVICSKTHTVKIELDYDNIDAHQ